ncbi:hypothetical protein BH20BAC1_BH20BAC1_00530 [soil metagenome]
MNHDAIYQWHKIAGSVKELPFFDNPILKFTIEDATICVVNLKDNLYACDARCPHAGAGLDDGKIDRKGNIVCPLHGYSFNIITGRDTFNEGYFLKKYPVNVNENGVFVGIKKGPENTN